jgi:hypothetical protein
MDGHVRGRDLTETRNMLRDVDCFGGRLGRLTMR